MILGMHMAGKSMRDISTHFNIHRNTVSNTIKKYRENGTTKNRPKSGRPRITTPAQDRYIRTQHLRDRFKTAVSLQALSLVFGEYHHELSVDAWKKWIWNHIDPLFAVVLLMTTNVADLPGVKNEYTGTLTNGETFCSRMNPVFIYSKSQEE